MGIVVNDNQVITTGQAALDAVEAARQQGRAADGHQVDLPLEPGKLGFALVFGAASLRANLDWDQVDRAIAAHAAMVRQQFDGLASEHVRTLARQRIIEVIQADEHRHPIQATSVITGCLWLIFTGPNAAPLKQMRDAGMLRLVGYTILDIGDGDYNFRLRVE